MLLIYHVTASSNSWFISSKPMPKLCQIYTKYCPVLSLNVLLWLVTIHCQWNFILILHGGALPWRCIAYYINIAHEHCKCWWLSSIIQHAFGYSSRHNFVVGGSVIIRIFWSMFLHFTVQKVKNQYVCMCLVIP